MKSPTELKYVDYQTKNGVAWITLNDPKRLNPLSLERVNDMRDALMIGEDDDDAVILCLAAQGEHFSGGAEIKPYSWGTGLNFFHSHINYHRKLWDQIWHSKKPVVAAIHGYTIGFTLETVLRCDIIIATEDTQLGYLEIQFASNYGNQKMGRLASEKIQKWYIFTGDLMPVEEAKHFGIVNKVVPKDKLEDAVYEFCDKVRRWSPTALWLNRLAINYGMNTDERTGVLIEDLMETLQSFTPDWAKGVTAMQTKPRIRPEFTNKIPKGLAPRMFGPDDPKPIVDTKYDSFIIEPDSED